LRERIIPAFEKAHGPEYQALFMVDNSQGHSAYPADALLVQQMNLGPGGKKPCMQNGWFMCGGEKVSHSMVMPSTDSRSLQSKGIQMILEERGLWPRGGLHLKCPQSSCIPKATTCCATCLIYCSQIFSNKGHLFKRPSRMLATYASFFQIFIVS